MTADEALYGLLVASLAVSLVCIAISLAMIGGKITILAYQAARGLDGTSRIQGIKDVRTHTMRLLTGVTFALFASLLMADAPMLLRMWVNRGLFVLLPLGMVIATCLDWLAEREQLRIEIAEERTTETTPAVTGVEAGSLDSVDVATIQPEAAADIAAAVAANKEGA